VPFLTLFSTFVDGSNALLSLNIVVRPFRAYFVHLERSSRRYGEICFHRDVIASWWRHIAFVLAGCGQATNTRRDVTIFIFAYISETARPTEILHET